MWVSGSLIRSSTWRSSSVSAPCISSSICLLSSPERSRTMRGSFCQALPIGCMRVFMTPSCSSAVTLESRCSGTLNSVSSLRREISSSWLRVSTSSETIVIRCSSVSTLTRIDWFATRSPSEASSPDALAAAALAAGLAFSATFASFATSGLACFAAACGCAAGAAAAGLATGLACAGATSIEVSWKARSSSSSDTSPGRKGRSSVCAIRLPCVTAGAAFAAGSGADVRCRHVRHAALNHRFQLPDQVLVISLRLGLGRFQLTQDVLDAIDRGQDQRHRRARHRHAVAEFAHQGLGRMGQRFQPRQSQKAAGPLDGVNQAEDVVQDLRVVRLLLEPHQLIVDGIEALARLRQKLPQQIIHGTGLRTQRHAIVARPSNFGQLLFKGFNIG